MAPGARRRSRSGASFDDGPAHARAVCRLAGAPGRRCARSSIATRTARQRCRTFAAVLSEQRGADMTWFFDQAMRIDARVRLCGDESRRACRRPPAGRRRSMCAGSVRRRSTARASRAPGRARDRCPSSSGLATAVRSPNGSTAATATGGSSTASASPAVLASVDPGAILLLDADRTNNTRALNPPWHTVGLRLAFNWLAWLQEAMLTCTAVL